MTSIGRQTTSRIACCMLCTLFLFGTLALAEVKIGLNYPKTGPYSTQGLDQLRAAELAVEEINAAGGINGEKVVLAIRDSQSKVDVTKRNVAELIDSEGVKMVFGGSSSAVAIAAGEVCQEKNIPFFGTLTYSNETTGTKAKRMVFRECNDSWSAAKVLANYMKKNFSGKKFFYITADYTWGHTTEASVRKFSNTEDETKHRRFLTPFPGAKEEDFKKGLAVANLLKPDVLVLVLFGDDMVNAVRLATLQGLKSRMQIIVPNLTLGMAEGGGPKVMEGVVGALPWTWSVPYKYGFEKGKKFVETFAAKHSRYPGTSGGSAYTILHEYKNAVERAGSFDSAAVVKALEGHCYTSLKDEQCWRDFDHQSIQTVYAVKCKQADKVKEDKFGLDYFEIIESMPGEEAFRTREQWEDERKAAGAPLTLEPLPE